MKFFVPITLALFTIACAAPKPGTAAHQRQLAEEARENFYALKARERKPGPPIAATQTTPPKKVRLKPFVINKPLVVNEPFAFINPFASKSRKPAPVTTRVSRPKKTPRTNDTVYYYDVPRGPEPTSPRYRAYKIQYARELAKRPEDLTSEERDWVRRHYRD